jgi:hypothetical protein
MEGMIRTGHLVLCRAALALVVALALTAAGWAHRLPSAPVDAVSAELALFIADGGSLADLCGTLPANTADRDHCPVCTLPAALPQPATAQAALRIARMAEPARFTSTAPAPDACHPAWNGRAPPVV